MATNRTFQDMLNEYLPNRLLAEELVKRDYILQKVSRDDNWKGGDLIVPFRGAPPSSISFGSLTSSTDIAESKKIRGKIDAYREVWGSIILQHTDLMQHDGPIPESTFIRLIEDELDEHMDYFKMATSIQLGSGPHFALVTDSTDAATGIFVVDRVDRFVLDQKATLDDDNSAATDVYVIAIDMNLSKVTFSATRGGAAADLSAYTAAQNAKFYHPGVFDAGGNHNTFISMRSALLSAANGGSANIHGKSKLAYPYLQAINVDGSTITATNILEKLFDAYVSVRQKAKGRAKDILMSYKHWGSVMKVLEGSKGAYRVVEDPKESVFGWWESTIASTSTGQSLKIVALQELDDDVIPFIDWDSVKFRTNGFFRKRQSPDGRTYFEVRNTTGFAYIVDLCLFGEMEYTKPGHNGIIYGVSY